MADAARLQQYESGEAGDGQERLRNRVLRKIRLYKMRITGENEWFAAAEDGRPGRVLSLD
jgi:hypothetical protein